MSETKIDPNPRLHGGTVFGPKEFSESKVSGNIQDQPTYIYGTILIVRNYSKLNQSHSLLHSIRSASDRPSHPVKS